MKVTFFTITLSLALLISVYGQSGSINNTLGTGGTFNIKDGSTTFLTLSQSNGYLGLNNCLNLPVTTDATLGVIYKGNDRFIHDYQAFATYGENTFVGINAGNFTMHRYNMSVNASYNSAFGYNSFTSNTTGYDNSAFGLNSLYSNSEGHSNSAFGLQALLYNTTGSNNSAFGNNALKQNSSGSYNTAIGVGAGFMNTTGSNNIIIGYNASVSAGDNQVRIGNAQITYAGIEVAWTITSDKRFKQDIHSLNSGLDFISNLHPVSYIRKNDKKQRLEYGFIAQDVTKVLKQQGIHNSGMITIDDKGFYHMRYNDLLAPMVKAIQELKKDNQLLRNNNKILEDKINSLQNSISELVKKEVRNISLEKVQLKEKTKQISLNKTYKPR